MVGDAKLTVSVTVKNTGTVDGDEVVQLYSRDMFASVVPNLKRLRGFERVSIKAGESKTVTFEITKSDLSFIKEDQSAHTFERVTEDGDFKLMVGGSSAFELDAPAQPWLGYTFRTYKGALNFYYRSK